MREQLISYVDLLFAGSENAGDVKQEILQNTLDRYDDLLSQGKTPQAAYSLAISGIGDISELLCNSPEPAVDEPIVTGEVDWRGRPITHMWKKVLCAIGICLYIMCPIPLFVLQNEIGLCGLLTFVAVATALMVISGGKKRAAEEAKEEQPSSPQTELRKAVKSIISIIGLCCYFIVSFKTGAWYITWLIFPIMAAAEHLAIAIMDLKEGK